MKKIILLFLFTTLSCSKSDSKEDITNNYPKEVKITYRVTSSDTKEIKGIFYKNEKGEQIRIESGQIPYELSIKKTVNLNDADSFSYEFFDWGTVTTEILINDVIVQSETDKGARDFYNTVSVFHIFK